MYHVYLPSSGYGFPLCVPDLPIIPEVDLAFAISANAAQSEANFQKMKDVISEVVELYGKERIHYSLVIFGPSPDVKILFGDEFENDERLKSYIQTFPRASGSALDKTLQKVMEIFESHARPGVKRVLVVMTDANSDSDFKKLPLTGSQLEDAKIKVITVGLGDELDSTELKAITPRKDNVIEKPTTVQSTNLAKEIMIKVLEGDYRCLQMLIKIFCLGGSFLEQILQ